MKIIKLLRLSPVLTLLFSSCAFLDGLTDATKSDEEGKVGGPGPE